MKIAFFTLGIVTFTLLFVITSSSALAQFGNLNTSAASPSPTLATSPVTGGTLTATPTVRVGAPAATTPAAGNAAPTLMILGSALFLLTLGIITWRKFSPKSA